MSVKKIESKELEAVREGEGVRTGLPKLLREEAGKGFSSAKPAEIFNELKIRLEARKAKNLGNLKANYNSFLRGEYSPECGKFTGAEDPEKKNKAHFRELYEEGGKYFLLTPKEAENFAPPAQEEKKGKK